MSGGVQFVPPGVRFGPRVVHLFEPYGLPSGDTSELTIRHLDRYLFERRQTVCIKTAVKQLQSLGTVLRKIGPQNHVSDEIISWLDRRRSKEVVSQPPSGYSDRELRRSWQRLAPRSLADKPPEHANLVRPFRHWFLLRRARNRAAARRHPTSSGRELRRRVLVALELLAWIDEQG